VFFVQLSPTLRFDDRRTADLTPLSMLPFMRPPVALMALRQRFSRSIDRSQLGDSLYVLLAHPAASRGGQVNEIDRYGELLATIAARRSPPRSQRRFERRLSRFIRRAQPGARTRPCRHLDPRALRSLDRFLRLTAASGSSVVFYLNPTHPRYRREVVVFYLNPTHPRYRREVLDHAAGFQHCRGLLIDHLRTRAATDDAVDFLDFTLLESIHGDASSAGYTDPFHLSPANGDRLIATAAPTLSAALARASTGSPRGHGK